MGEKLKSIRELFDERTEIMAWLTLALGTGLLVGGFVTDSIFLGMVITSLSTMLGTDHLKGLKAGTNAVE